MLISLQTYSRDFKLFRTRLIRKKITVYCFTKSLLLLNQYWLRQGKNNPKRATYRQFGSSASLLKDHSVLLYLSCWHSPTGGTKERFIRPSVLQFLQCVLDRPLSGSCQPIDVQEFKESRRLDAYLIPLFTIFFALP